MSHKQRTAAQKPNTDRPDESMAPDRISVARGQTEKDQAHNERHLGRWINRMELAHEELETASFRKETGVFNTVNGRVERESRRWDSYGTSGGCTYVYVHLILADSKRGSHVVQG